MAGARSIWLIHNDNSGSNDRAALEQLHQTFGEHGLELCWRTSFPREKLPTPAMLDAAKADMVAIFAGDGTVNASLDALAGWSGQVLILPGGTMNLLYHRLFGQATLKEAIAAAASGKASPRRPGMIRSCAGNAYSDLLAGPGTRWNDVREAMRATNVPGMASEFRAAFAETLEGDPVHCHDPAMGRREGYPLMQLEPHDDHFTVKAYHAETTAEFLEQLLAVVTHQFREGPHDVLGQTDRLSLSCSRSDGVGLLLDGEPARGDAPCEFVLARCQVDLLATRADD